MTYVGLRCCGLVMTVVKNGGGGDGFNGVCSRGGYGGLRQCVMYDIGWMNSYGG